MKTVFLLLAGIIFFSQIISVVSAEEIGIGFSPPVAELIASPGSELTISYEIENTKDPAIIELRVVSSYPEGNAGTMSFSENIDNKIVFKPQESKDGPFAIFMPGQSKRKTNIKISIPDDIEAGDYYFSILAHVSSPQIINNQSSLSIEPGVASLLLITVPHNEGFENKARLGNFSIYSRFRIKIFGRVFNIIDSMDKLPVTLTIKNKGIHLIKPRGTISVRDSFGNKSSFELIPVSILRSSSRLIPAASAQPCNNTACQSSSLILSGFFIGKNQVDLNVNFGLGSAKIVSQATFYALPLKLILIVILILILLRLFLKTSRNL